MVGIHNKDHRELLLKRSYYMGPFYVHGWGLVCGQHKIGPYWSDTLIWVCLMYMGVVWVGSLNLCRGEYIRWTHCMEDVQNALTMCVYQVMGQ